ncbi:MAG TPA: DUF4258 domain-containing protein [Kiritimatiellia bacterium]|nr:DUF4258 domain-containing protein [Kiritimatiellia bacterium]HRZ12312.1 DUF4258 domain-containing protein [Kiritimatiellia bacterium]HSA17930.1 DUF4258 domain-containing protein [Kiritimatiellia bacterium]
MRYRLSRHAAHVLHERGIAEEWLERVLREPQKVEPDEEDRALEHRLACIPEHGHRVLRVVVNKSVRPEKVVTVYFDRAMKGKL